MSGSVVVEADGGSRGNPGPAAYGALLRDAATGQVLAETGEAIGVATNNVAEYRGLLAGLSLRAEHAPDAALEVRMDSKLVVEQMAGRWRVKHPDLLPLAEQARALAPADTVWTWVPRAQNAAADRLVNLALDAPSRTAPTPSPPPAAVPAPRPDAPAWVATLEAPTTLVLVRHGVTEHTLRRTFSGGLASADPGLTEEGREQVRATGAWLAPLAAELDALVSSPVRRTRESAEILADLLGHEVRLEEGLAEMEFGTWDGLTFAEVRERYPADLDAWLGSLDVAPGGGESYRVVEERVLAARDRLLASYDGRTVLAVSHVTPIKTLVADALGAPLTSLHRMELAPAAVTVLTYHPALPEGRPATPALRLFNARPTDLPFTSPTPA